MGRHLQVGLVLLGAMLAGCAGTAPLKPRPITTEIPALGLPPTALQVVDERSTRGSSDALVHAVEQTVQQALGAPAGSPRYTLTVRIRRHEVTFPGSGNAFWYGDTSLHAALTSPSEEIARWSADDQDQQWNSFGYSSGTTAAQNSLRDALRKLLRQIAARDFSNLK